MEKGFNVNDHIVPTNTKIFLKVSNKQYLFTYISVKKDPFKTPELGFFQYEKKADITKTINTSSDTGQQHRGTTRNCAGPPPQDPLHSRLLA